MGIVELIEIALANADDRRVEVTALEPAELFPEAVGGLAELIFELVNNAIAFSAPDEKVVLAGFFDQETYLISVSGRGVGIPEDAIGVLNRMLEDPELTLSMAFVARLAARHGLAVRLVPGVPGTTALVTVPANIVERIENVDRQQADEPAGPGDAAQQDAEEKSLVDSHARIGHVVARSESAWRESEAFLEKVFAPLMREWQESARPATRSTSSGGKGGVEIAEGGRRSPVEREPHGTATLLQVRVPGETFLATEDDSPSTAAAEAAVDIRSALSTFDHGRRSAELGADRDDG